MCVINYVVVLPSELECWLLFTMQTLYQFADIMTFRLLQIKYECSAYCFGIQLMIADDQIVISVQYTFVSNTHIIIFMRQTSSMVFCFEEL